MNAFSILNSKSIRVRFFSTLVANVIRFALNFFASLFIARALGPADFGNFNFLFASFTSISMLIDMGTSSAFYTFISRRRRASSFYFYYFLWIALQFVVTFLLATVLLPGGMRNKIWLGHGRDIVVLSLFASFSMNQLWKAVSQAGESIRATVTVQAFNVLLAVVHVLMILAIIRLNILSVANLFLFITGEYVVFSVLLTRRLRDKLIDPEPKKAERFKDIFKEFKTYCSPLIVYSWGAFFYTFADNWLLQNFGGATEQGYYSIGMRFTFVSAVATGSMLQVFWKETAEAIERQDYEHVQRLYYKVSRILYFSAATISCFLMPFSRELLVWLLGPSYEQAWTCLTIILLYPLLQALGQTISSIYLAAGHTKLYRNLGIIFMFISIPAAYFILAPPDAYYAGGLGLGSVGIALKMVALTFVSINVQIYIISRIYRWKFDFLYQIAVVALLLPAAFIAKLVIISLLGTLLVTISTPTLLFSSMILYSLGVAAVVYIFPRLTGFSRDELKSMLDKAKTVLTLANKDEDR